MPQGSVSSCRAQALLGAAPGEGVCIWELRLQDEIRPDFTIDEPASDATRAKFLVEHPSEAAEILAAELKRRERKAAKAQEEESGEGELFEGDDEPEEEAWG